MKVEVTGETERTIRAALASGRYASADEFIAAVIRDRRSDARDSKVVPQDPATPTAYDLFERLGVIGSMTDGPSDLATNPEHMEGFGR